MCVFDFFLNDGKDNCLKSLSKLFQILTALWRKRRWPDFVLLGGTSRGRGGGGGRPFMHLNAITVSL